MFDTTESLPIEQDTTTCRSGIAWCTNCTDDHDGTRFHRTTITAEDLVEVEVCQVTDDPDGGDVLEFEIRVHDEPPLTAVQAQRVPGLLQAALARVSA